MGNPNQTMIDYLLSRRSVPAKALGEPGPDAGEIETLLTIASRVPDHGKLAPWRFVEITPAAAARLGERVAARAAVKNPQIDEAALELERNRFSRAPCCLMLVSRTSAHPKIPQWEQELSAGAAGMNLLIAANALGYEAQWITEWIAFDEELRGDFAVEEGERIAGFFHIGTPTMPKTERDRPALDTIFSRMES